MKILVVDDDEIALIVAEKVLVSGGHEVIRAEDGEKALEILQQEQVQIVITDWNMPRMDGAELCRKIRQASGFGYIYVIMVTSRTSTQDRVGGLDAGADDYISKPFEPEELRARVRIAERILNSESISLVVFLLARLAESKDTDTGEHLERMRQYSKILAENLIKDPLIRVEVPLNFPELMYQASPLHDIGKVGIPEVVLMKPGSLNDDEWAIMKRHTIIGAETLEAGFSFRPGVEFLRIARDIARYHHERWDGSGYPQGLRAEEIPICARIVAVADVYDAVTMKRVYKMAMPHEVARGIIVDGSGGHFAPRVVEAFLQCEHQFLEVRNRYPDQCC